MRRRFAEALLAIYFAMAPSTIPSWRVDPTHRPAAVLMVGAPVPMLTRRSHPGVRFADSMAPDSQP